MLRVELHVHSALSYDGRDPVGLIVEQAAAIGLDALAITDHDEIDASLEAAALAEDLGMIGIPGIEISSEAGHILGIGIRERIPAGLSYDETLHRIRDAGGVAIIPHPFQESRHGVATNITPDQLCDADAIEVYNSRLLTGRGNRRAREFATAHNIPMTAGSDAHISEMVGQAVTLIDTGADIPDPTVADILEAIRAGRTMVDGKRTPWRISLRQAAGGMKRRVAAQFRSMR